MLASLDPFHVGLGIFAVVVLLCLIAFFAPDRPDDL